MKPKNPTKLFPLILTDELEATKRCYVQKLGFEVTFDLPNYLQVRLGQGPDALELCFMRPSGFPDGRTRPAYAGQGLIVSIPVENADAAYERMKHKGAQVEDEPTDKPWGWRSFFVRDPNGVTLDFFHVYQEVDAGSMSA